MYFPSGLINIRNILIISLIIQLILSILIFFKTFEKNTRTYNYKCISDKHYYLTNTSELKIFRDFEDFKKICEDIQLNKENPKITFYRFSFDLDSGSYFVNLAQLNQLFYATKNLDEIFDKVNLNSTNNIKKIIKLKEFISKTKIKHLEKLRIYSSLYVNFFDSNNYLYEFILFINFITLSFIIILLFKISKKIFPSISSNILYLCILNIIINPILWIYFLSFYKEPLILLSFSIIIFNFIHILFGHHNFKQIIFLTFLVLISITLINYIKPEYYLILLAGYLIGICFALVKNFNKSKILFIQLVIIALFSFAISKNYNFLFYDSQNNLNSKFFNTKNDDLINSLNLEEIKVDIKIENNNEQKKSFSKDPVINDNYYFPKHITEKKEDYDELNCHIYIGDFLCKKLNSFGYRIYSIKNATLWENNFFSENSNPNKNIINPYELNSTTKIIFKAPISLLKFIYMPFLLSENIIIVIISFFKVTISVLYLICMLILYKRKKYNYLYSYLGIILIFLPLGLATDLVASNFFTYYRYIYPINIFVLFMLYLFLVYNFTNKND